HKVLVEWNSTVASYPADTIHGLFERQARRVPDQTAIMDGELRLTYQELNERSNRIARFLRKSGVEPEALVGVCLERGADMAASVLGILKAGAAYVPLDPYYPRERLTFMLEDAGIKLAITQPQWTSVLEGCGVQILCLDRIEDRLAREQARDCEPRDT